MALFLFSIYASLFLGVSLILWHLLLALSLGYKSYGSNNTTAITTKQSPLSSTNKALQLSAISAYIFVSFGGVCVVIPRVHYLVHDISIDNPMFATSHSLYLVSMALAYVSAYFFMVCRLYITFKGSSYAIRTSMIKMHIGIATTTLSLGFASVFSLYRGFDIFIVNGLFSAMLLLIMFSLVYLVYEFNQRLFHFVLLFNAQKDLNVNHVEEAKSLSHRQLTMLLAVKRQNIWGMFIVFLMFIAIANYMTAVGVNNGKYVTFSVYPSSQIHMMVFDLVLVLMIHMASLSVYLGFFTNSNCYKRFCKTMNDTKANRGDAVEECVVQIQNRVTTETTETE